MLLPRLRLIDEEAALTVIYGGGFVMRDVDYAGLCSGSLQSIEGPLSPGAPDRYG